MASAPISRSIRWAAGSAVAALLLIACVGQAERTYFDDGTALDDAGGPDSQTSQADVSVPDASDGGARPDGGDAGEVSDASDASVVTHTIGGTVIGLEGSGLVLRLNGKGDKTIPTPAGGANVPFVFSDRVAEGESFAVTIKTQPSAPTQSCQVIGGTGVVGGADVTSVVVNCATNQYVVGGVLSGLEGSVTLQNNGADDLLLTSNGTFGFLTPLKGTDPYVVTVSAHSALPAQTCNVTNGSGTIVDENVSDVSVSCTTNEYSVGGTVTGLTTGTLVLSSANGGTASVTSDGSFTLPDGVLSNRDYDVEVSSAPAGLTCRVTNGSGKVTTAPVSDVVVTCVPKNALVENFDGVTVPGLPSGWSSVVVDSAPNVPSFVTTNLASGVLPASQSSPSSAFLAEHDKASSVALTSPSFTVSSNVAQLTFFHAYALEASGVAPTTAYDGVVLEISTNDGATWSDIDPLGDNSAFVKNGYERTISSSFTNPLGGRRAWSGRSTAATPVGWKQTVVKLPLTSGQSARLRFRLGTDKQNVVSPYEGWRIDSLAVTN